MPETDSAENPDSEFRWPQPGDRIFAPISFPHGAFVVREPRERMYHMRQGYKLAADFLVQRTEADAWMRRKLVYPIIHSYRHFLELTLKEMLAEYGRMGGQEPNWSTHDLKASWSEFRLLLSAVDPGHEDPGTEDAVMRGVDALAWSKTSSRTKGLHRNLGDLAFGQEVRRAMVRTSLVRVGKAESRRR